MSDLIAAYNRAKFSRDVSFDDFEAGWNEAHRTPASPAVQPVGDWKDALYAAMDEAFLIRENRGSTADGGMVIDDTQIGVEFAMRWVEKHFAAAPAQADAGADAKDGEQK